MKLPEQVLKIRKMIHTAFLNRFEKLGLYETTQKPIAEIESDQLQKRQALETILANHLEENQGNYPEARFQAIDECTFTLFNRIAAIKVMESRELFPEIIKQRVENGNRSFAHTAWLEEHPEERSAEREGLKSFLRDEFDRLGDDLYLFNQDYPYALLPTADELYRIIDAFNQVEEDADCGVDTWRNDDILGWLYESYNAIEKEQLKASGVKTEFDKVSLQSQVYTPKWVVKFLVDNSLGKLYLEMFPDSALRENYKIANVPTHSVRHSQPLEELKLIDPACGSGNFLLYAFDLFYDMYVDQMEHYNADYSRREIPRLIIERNLHGIDLDERAVQIAQLGLYIKARTHRGRSVRKYNVIASHFILPEYEEVKEYFEAGEHYDDRKKTIMCDIWNDLRAAYKFGSLVRVEEKLKAMMPHEEISLFSVSEMQDVFSFRQSFVTKLRNHLQEYSSGLFGNSFMRFRTNAAMDFLDIISKKYDVAVANPPYTDSADFGVELKTFVEENYKKPLKFNTNLYASFIKRCCELTDVDGKVGMIHPMTFMYIKTFEDVRKFILEETRINLFVEYGLSNLFGSVMVDPAFYVLEKKVDKAKESVFISLDQYTRTPEEKNKKEYCLQALTDYVDGIRNKHIYTLPQSKLKGIKSYPFIYWISDEFREKFASADIDNVLYVRQGGATGNNERTLRFHWEVNVGDISKEVKDGRKYTFYPKGGPFEKWYGNNWIVIGYKDPETYRYLKTHGNRLPSETFYLKEGVTYCSSGSRGCSFRYMPRNQVISGAGPGVYPSDQFQDIYYFLGFLNSKLSTYLLNCLNPTVNVTQGDIKRIPFYIANKNNVLKVSDLSNQCVCIKRTLCFYSVIEHEYMASPIMPTNNVLTEIHNYFNYENALLTQVLINEALINDAVFEVYALNDHDKQMVLDKEGIPVGSYPLLSEAKAAYIDNRAKDEKYPLEEEQITYIQSLPELEELDETALLAGFETLYQNNNDLEEFCIRHKVNPINVWYLFREHHILPAQRTQVLVFELITDVIRQLLADDDDGVIPIIERSGEEQLAIRLEQAILLRGFSAAQFGQMVEILGGDINSYLQNRFFAQLSDHLNLFMYLPKTPFIWHISSGKHHALECFVSIYKWSRDTLFRLKSIYVANRETALRDRLINLSVNEDGASKMECELIREQLNELDAFRQKVDELLAEGYEPKLDDGVGKNIAPLQQKGMLSYDVLNAGQLKKYLNADW